MSFTLVIFATFLCSLVTAGSIEQQVATPENELSLLSQASTEFTLDFLRILHDDEKPNIVFSPLGIQTIFAALMHGASDITQQQLLHGLRLDNISTNAINEEMHKMLSAYKRSAADKSRDILFENANLFMISKSFSIKKEYQDFLEGKYLATALKEDFTQAQEVQRHANSWVNEKTHGLIPKLIEKPLSPQTTLAIFNAIYFKGEWKTPFPLHLTSKNSFWSNGEEEIQVDVMYKSSITVNYTENKELNLRAIRLPYEGSASMYIILPTNRTGLKKVKNSLNAANLESLFRDMKRTTIELSLPKFKIQNEMNLNELLPSMGIKEVFTHLATLSKISEQNIRVGESKQAAVIEVNERGTQAAAATMVTAIRFSAGIVPLVQFQVDHPFMFFVRDDISGMTLFAGEVKNPAET